MTAASSDVARMTPRGDAYAESTSSDRAPVTLAQSNVPKHSDAANQAGDLVVVPAARKHRDQPVGSLRGEILAVLVAQTGGFILGAGYGAIIALCGDNYFNLFLAFSFPFWIHMPAGFGFLWGRVPRGSARRRIEVVGMLTCIYGVYVGWTAAVLDGPGWIFNPVELVQYLFDPYTVSLWAVRFDENLLSMRPYIVTMRVVEFLWITSTALMTLGSASPFPYCKACREWMTDEASVRLVCEPESNDEAKRWTQAWVDEDYEPLLSLESAVAEDEKSKGTQLTVHSCPECNAAHVFEATWYRTHADESKSEFEQLIESKSGTQLVRRLIVPEHVRDHIHTLAESKAA